MLSRVFSFIGYVAVPIAGVIFFGWDWRSIIILYWLENITVGVQTLIAMGRTKTVNAPGKGLRFTISGMTQQKRTLARIPMMLFFTVHYGIFTVVHGVFVLTLTFGMLPVFGLLRGSAAGDVVESLPVDMTGILLIWGVASLVQLIAGLFEPRDQLAPVNAIMVSPYRRIFALHITILGGAWLISYFGWPPITALLLIAVHFVLDLRRK